MCNQIQQEVADQLTLDLADLQTKYRATVGYKTGVLAQQLREVRVPWVWILRMLGHRLFPMFPEQLLKIKS